MSYYITPHETIYALTSTEVKDGSDLDVVFERYMRSPSLSHSLSLFPLPADVASELSGATLISSNRD
jgi:hypothetical protein